MFPKWLLYIDGGEHKSFDALSYHLVNENTKHQKGKNKNAWQTTMSNGLMAIRTKGMYKACWTLTQRTYEIWWYDQGCGKPR
jgi:hypothetical protein